MDIGLMAMIAAIIVFVVIPSFKDRVIPIKRLLIAPGIFMYLLYDNVTTHFYLNFSADFLLLAGLILGPTIGVLMRYNTEVKPDHIQHTLWIPGTYTTLVTFLLIFIVHFIVGYLQSVEPYIFNHVNSIELILLFMLACTSSITVGTSLCLYTKYYLADEEQ